MYSSSAIAEKISRLRVREGLTLGVFAEKIGVSTQGVSGFEKGKSKPSVDTLIKISEEFKVTVDWLLSKEEVRPNQQVTVGNVHGHGNAAGIDNKVTGAIIDQECQQKLAVALAELEGYKREISRLEQIIELLKPKS